MGKKLQKLHNELQSTINNMQKYNDEIRVTLVALCIHIARIVGYKHEKKCYYRILVTDPDMNEYDVDDLIKQTEEYIKLGKK